MDISEVQNLGYGTAAAVVAITALAAIFRKWKRSDKIEEELKDAEEKYNQALDNRDMDLAATYLQWVQKLKKRLGKT